MAELEKLEKLEKLDIRRREDDLGVLYVEDLVKFQDDRIWDETGNEDLAGVYTPGGWTIYFSRDHEWHFGVDITGQTIAVAKKGLKREIEDEFGRVKTEHEKMLDQPRAQATKSQQPAPREEGVYLDHTFWTPKDIIRTVEGEQKHPSLKQVTVGQVYEAWVTDIREKVLGVLEKGQRADPHGIIEKLDDLIIGGE